MEGPLSGQPLEDSHHGENQPDHGIAFRKDHVEALFPLMDGRAGHYVFVSSFVVYGTGVRNRAFQMVPEDEADLSLATGCDYAVGKRQCESVLKCDPVLKRETVLKCDSVLTESRQIQACRLSRGPSSVSAISKARATLQTVGGSSLTE